MTSIDEDPRKFQELDAHGVQEALREEMGDNLEEIKAAVADETAETGDDTEVLDAVAHDSVEADQDEIADDETMSEETEDLVWTAAQMAEHVRMAEALLFAAVEPLDEKSIADRLPEGADVPALLEVLKAQYENRGVTLSKISKKWRFVTAPDVAHVLTKERVEQRKLSRAALETLAIIAYHQPCTRADIEDVRGVAVSKGSLDQLMEIGWVRLRGRRKDVPGRPVLYGTTQDFLEHFGLEGLGDLPGMADLKASGLLEARLPPDFQIPTPRDQEEGEVEDGEEEAAEFAQDFLDGEIIEVTEEVDLDEEEEAVEA